MDNRLDQLKRKLASRKGKSAYRDNVPLLEAEIARLEQLAENNHDSRS